MSATAVTFSWPTCRCLISVVDHFPEILLIIFQTLLMGVRLFINETKLCRDWRLVDFILLVWPRIILYCWIFRAFFLFLMASLYVSLSHTVLCLPTQNLLLGILLFAVAIIFSLNSSNEIPGLLHPSCSLASWEKDGQSALCSFQLGITDEISVEP